MEPFTIHVHKLTLTVHPQEDCTFIIKMHSVKYCTLSPKIGINMVVQWSTTDPIPLGLVDMIGLAIEQHIDPKGLQEDPLLNCAAKLPC